MNIKPLRKNKKGVLGLETVRDVILSLMIMAVLAVAAFLALVSLRDAGIFESSTTEYNATSDIVANITEGTASFFSNIPTIFSILVVVVIILAIAIVIAVVSGFGRTGGTGL